MTQYLQRANIHVAATLCHFIENEVLPGLSLQATPFWQGFSKIIADLSPENQRLLDVREQFQLQIDQWYQQHPQFNLAQHKRFLHEIGYIVPEVADFHISTDGVDDEIAKLAGPQLVVPITNARFALNAVNARWGSLYDALYGSDVISESGGAERTPGYNPVRGAKVIDYAKEFLNQCLALKQGQHQQVTGYHIEQQQLHFILDNGESSELADATAFIGYCGDKRQPDKLLLRQHGLHIELSIDRQHPIGQQDAAGLCDIQLESALTTIMDCEDSVAAVDSEDKVLAYRNWLGLNQGILSAPVTKNGREFQRRMADERHYLAADDKALSLKGRSLMFVRNVGHLMRCDAILDRQQQPVFEGIIDAVITSLIALHDRSTATTQSNSRHGSIYIVKPKMHGPDEVRFACSLFSRVEQLLALPENTIKLGIMDEERRTSVNLKACIFEARQRLAFINTGFLDRTGDEIHTCMAAGPVERKNDIKHTRWIAAYEQNNVDLGLACGLSGTAQIGKGMWPVPDQMAAMLEAKIAHPQAGANTAWVPSPTAATIHALHYHQVDVFALQQQLKQRQPAALDDILTPPLAGKTRWSEQQVNDELDNNIQGILGYVVRWIDQGIGCSKVPDIHDVGLMEDRATLRISSQHIANWLKHGVCTPAQVDASLAKMAAIVDRQNAQDPLYRPMSVDLDSNIAFQAATALIYQGEQQPNGYTEPLLHHFRRMKKQQAAQ